MGEMFFKFFKRYHILILAIYKKIIKIFTYRLRKISLFVNILSAINIFCNLFGVRPRVNSSSIKRVSASEPI